MEWISGWIQGIIIAVIISTIIEMILPEGTSKKYIKVVIGVYILFSIISPVITKVTGNNFRVSDILDLDEYIEASKNSGSLQNKLENQNQNQIKEVYLSGIKNDIKEKVENKGYVVNSVNLEIENDEQYTLKKIDLKISKKAATANSTKTSNTTNIVDSVNEVKIDAVTIQTNKEINNSKISNTSEANTNLNKKSAISSQEKKELKDYLSGVYEISVNKIFINQ